MRGRKGPLRLIRDEKTLPEADEGKESPLCYEADDRLTPDEQGLEADEGGKASLRLMRGRKDPLCYEADDRLTPDERGLEADKGKNGGPETDEGGKAPVSVA